MPLEIGVVVAKARSARAVDDLLKLVQERTGLLVDLGADRYQFVHLSLHEYLAACFVLDRLTEAESVRVLRHYLHAPQWEEVLRLAVGKAGEARCEGLLGAVLGEPSSEWEGRLHRDLRFVMRCVGDRVAIGVETRRQIESRVLAALASPETLDRDGLVRDAAAMGPSASVAELFRRELDDEDRRVRSMAAQYFTQLGADDAETRQAFLKKLEDEDESVRSTAVEYLAQLGADDAETRQAFLKKLEDEDEIVRYTAVEYFARLGVYDEETRQALLRKLEDQRGSVRYAAVQASALLGMDDKETRQALLRKLDDNEWYVRARTVERLLWLGAGEADARQAVLGKLEDKDETVRESAVEYLIRFGVDDLETRHAVLKKLDDQDAGVRFTAIRYFGQLGVGDADVKQVVLRKLGADDVESPQDFLRKLDDEDEAVRTGVITYWIEAGGSESAEDVLRALGKESFCLSTDNHRKLSEKIGKLAAADDALLATVLEKGSDTRYFLLDLALASAAAERDRLRRETTPLTFSSPDLT